MSPALQRRRGVIHRHAAQALTLLAAFIGPLAIASTNVAAHSYKLGEIAVGHVWTPPPEQGAEGLAVYGPILNRGEATVRFIGASTPVAERVRFRRTQDGEATWPRLIELRPGKPLALAAWREHIWVSGLRQPLQEGDTFDLRLDFGTAGEIEVKVVVEKATGH